MEELEDERKKLEEQIALEEGDESFDEAIDEDSDSSNSDQGFISFGFLKTVKNAFSFTADSCPCNLNL